MAEQKKNTNTKKTRSSGLRSLELWYRPVFDTHLNMAIDFETSLRINDKTMGVILPETFLPIAEKSTQICDLDYWMIEEACEAIKRCEKREVDINSLIVPISVKHMARKNIVTKIMKILDAKDTSPDKFCFKLNQSILEADKAQVIENIQALREQGFFIEIDDFGTEYTSLTHLSHYEVDYIGIHESLLDDIEESERAQNIVQGIIDFTKKIETQVTVDGINSPERAELLKKMGADRMKGSLYGKPIKEKQIKGD